MTKKVWTRETKSQILVLSFLALSLKNWTSNFPFGACLLVYWMRELEVMTKGLPAPWSVDHGYSFQMYPWGVERSDGHIAFLVHLCRLSMLLNFLLISAQAVVEVSGFSRQPNSLCP